MQQKRKHAARRRHRAAPAHESGARVLPTLFKSMLLAFPLSLGVGLLLVLITTALLLKTEDPDRYHTVAGILLLYLTALIGGWIANRLYGRRAPVLCGLGMGFAFFLLFTVLALAVPTEGDNGTALALLFRTFLIPTAMAGAGLATRSKRRHRKR